MSIPGSRRNFFDRIRIGLTGLAISRALPFETAAAAPSAAPPAPAAVDYYDKLGVKFQTYKAWLAAGAKIPRAVVAH